MYRGNIALEIYKNLNILTDDQNIIRTKVVENT